MTELEEAILEGETNGSVPRLVVRSSTTVDAGRWWRRTPLWLCITEHDVVVFAAARRRYSQRFPIAACQGSYYCHVTGELVLDAGEELRFSRLAMSPVDGIQVMNALNTTSKNNPQS